MSCYDDIYDSYYKDPFDPVEDGVIADPGDIDDALKSVDDIDVTTSADNIENVTKKGNKTTYTVSSDITKDVRKNKPLNSPDIDAWYEKGDYLNR